MAENYTPYSPHVESTLLNWGATDPGLYTMSYNGQKYVPNAVLQKVGNDMQPIDPSQSDLFRSLREHGLRIQTPATQGEFTDVSPLVSEAVQAMGIDESAKYRQLSRQTQIMNVLAGLYNNPNIATYSGAYTAKTRRALRPEEMRALANQGTAEAMTIDPTAFPEVKKLSQRYLDIIQNLETEEGGVVFPRTGASIKIEDVINEANRMRTSEGTEEARGHAGQLLQYPIKLLRGFDGKPAINDDAVATQALKDNQMLLIATHAADVYGSADRVLQAERQGLGVLPTRAKQYLQYLFFMNGQPWDLGEQMLGRPNEGYPDLRTIKQQPQQQQQGGAFPQRGGMSPTPGDTTPQGASGLPTTTQSLDAALQQGAAVRGRAGQQVNVNPAIQPAYQWFYGALSSDTSAYPRIMDKLDEIFGGTSEQAAASLEHYGFPKAIADSVRRFPSQANRHRRNLTEALRQARIDLLNPQQ